MSGMRYFSAGELARMRVAQTGAMQDTARIWYVSEVEGAEGGLANVPEPGPVVSCGVNFATGRADRRLEYINPVTQVTARLPLGTTIRAGDRFEILTRYGAALSPTLMFRVDGPPLPGPTGIVIQLARAEGVSGTDWD